MSFDHEKLDVYRLAIEFIAWVGDRLETSLKKSGMSATKHLDEASQSIANNIAEGNGKRSSADRCRFLDIARGSALECAACLDALAARRRITKDELAEGKLLLERIVSMLWRMIELFQTSSSPKTSTRVERRRGAVGSGSSGGRPLSRLRRCLNPSRGPLSRRPPVTPDMGISSIRRCQSSQ
jgi:four helix bundle protein